MLEFLTALFIYFCALLGLASNNADINLFDHSLQFTVYSDSIESDTPLLSCADRYYAFVTVDVRGETLSDVTCYSAADLTGQVMTLPAGTVVSISSVSESGSVFSFWKNSERWYTSTHNIDIISDEILGISTELTLTDEELPSNFVSENGTDGARIAYAYFKLLPVFVQKAFNDSDMVIVVTDEDLQDKYDRDNAVAGITVYAENKVYLKDSDYAIRYSIYHEIAHVLDMLLKRPSTSDEFLEIFAEERDNYKPFGLLKDGYHKTNSQEYFAVAMQTYLMSGNTMESYAPRTYEFIERQLAVLEDKYR